MARLRIKFTRNHTGRSLRRVSAFAFFLLIVAATSLIWPSLDRTTGNAVTARQNTRIVRAVNAAFQRNQSNELKVELESPGDVNAIGLTLRFDPAVLRLTPPIESAIVKGSGIGDSVTLLFNPNNEASGSVVIGLSLQPPNSFPSGKLEILKIKFTPVSASSAATTQVRVTDLQVADFNLTALPATAADATVTLAPSLSITTASPLATGIVGASYSNTLAASGGSQSYSWAITGGALPNGLSLSTAGALTGTPTLAGAFNFTARVTDRSSTTASKAFDLVINNPVPMITSLNPGNAIVGDPVFTLTVNGNNFVNGSTVIWNGSPRTTTFVSSTQLTASIPAGDVAVMGSPGVTVFNPTPGGGTSNKLDFIVNNPMPGITSLSPNSAAAGSAGFTLTVNGSKFVKESKVRWNNVDRPTTVVSASQLTAAISASDLANAGAANVQAFNPPFGGGASNSLSFTILAPFQLANVTPLSTPFPGRQFFARLDGSGFDPSTIQVAVLGPGCPNENSCVVPNNLLIGKSATRIEQAPLTLGEGVFQILVRNGSGTPVSNRIQLVVNPLVTGVSAASFVGIEMAADSIIALFSTNMAPGVEVAQRTPLPTTLLGTSVKIKDSAGVERLAELFFVAPSQVNCRVPAGTSAGLATITVMKGNDVAAVGQMQIAAVAPGLFTANANGQGVAAAVALRVKAGGSQSFEAVSRFDQATGRFVPVPIDLGLITDQVFLLLFGTGIRGRSALSGVAASIGGIGVETPFAGPQSGFVGLDQINVGPIPRSLIGRGTLDIVLRVDGKTANAIQVNIR
jgi:uncharacterized protein (TIGR03437 family)